ncbi:MAG: Two component regulator three Y domain-containing protein [Muricauda sp.]|nr:Two component regulator three Y domain-containing protein [Allomuricauda sp.]MAU26799.1 Two component regulator three Y domain-containing protein [Allomuricauda sp.]MBC30590.1 Two component regulator three Y domain-containing protein [Allomuricauda sp.]|tara:strand:+ start:26659 stop:29418 length:2760 start_codon:yes stop_codon:yes gene_type:complete
MPKLLKLVVCFLLASLFLNGQDLLPPIYNYSLLDYKAGSKNWGLAVSDNGELYAANNQGLLHYDGERWTLNKLPNKTIVRSLAVVDDKIYTGSYEEFGYWQKNDKGLLEYTSLTHLIKGRSFTSEEFWEILPVEDYIVFRSFSAIYVFKKGKIQVIDPPEVVSDLILHKGKILVAAGAKGLYELTENEIVPLENQELLNGKTVTDMVPYKGGILVGTKLNGCFLFDGNKLQPWEAPINEELIRHQLNKLLNLGGNMLALGTIKNGVYLYDSETGQSQIINRKYGLQNNTILSMTRFGDQFWLGLDNGIARVRLNYPITYYTDQSGALGMVYDIAHYNNRLYLGSNTGVFYFDKGELEIVEGSVGHVWDLEVLGDDLICGHNTGTFKVVDTRLEKISDISGGYEIKKIPESNDVYIQGTYNGLVKFQKDSQGQWQATKIMGVDFPIKQLCFENPQIVWAAHPYKGLYRIHLDKQHRTVTKTQQYNGNDGVPSQYNIKLFNIKNQLVFYSEGKWFKYDPIMNRIVVFDEFQKFNNKELLFFDQNRFWFVAGEGNKEILRTDLKNDSLLLTDLPLQKRLAPDSQKMVKMGDSTLFVTLNDGFANIDQRKLKSQLDNLALPTPFISGIIDEESRYALNKGAIDMPYHSSRIITIELASPALMQARYRYELAGPETRSGFVGDGGRIQFQNLPHGPYELAVSVVSIDNRVSPSSTIYFEIAPPWFLSNGMVALYIVIGLGTIAGVRWYNRRKLKRKQREMIARLEKEQEERMAELERERLEKEIKLKQNELASTTLNIAKKNEMILELKNLLVMNKDKFSNSQRYRSFMKKLNNSVKDTEDWKRFEVNFKELHEDFFERLLKEYPNLTPKDLKLCAYLKMNLSTKEIAPLMAISIRGIEIHRYRLRKKLKIDSSENLSNFLITF